MDRQRQMLIILLIAYFVNLYLLYNHIFNMGTIDLANWRNTTMLYTYKTQIKDLRYASLKYL